MQNDWISVGVGKMPPKGQDVLVYIENLAFPELTGIYMGALLDDGWWIRYTEGTFPLRGARVTHSMPLPAPPGKPAHATPINEQPTK